MNKSSELPKEIKLGPKTIAQTMLLQVFNLTTRFIFFFFFFPQYNYKERALSVDIKGTFIYWRSLGVIFQACT